MKEEPIDQRELLRAAGPGDRVPEEELAPIRARVHTAWRAQVRRTATRRMAGRAVLAFAAVILLALGVLLLRRPPAEPAGPSIAAVTIETVVGTATVGVGRAATAGDEIAGGDAITTADSSRAALRLATGTSVRIDVRSSVRVASGHSLRLDRGAVYVDTGAESRAPGEAVATVEIQTPFGMVTDLGTRFEVRLLTDGAGDTPSSSAAPSALEIRVRDGAVRLAAASATYDAAAGSALVVHDEVDPERSTEAPYGADWSWVEGVRPPVAIEGITCASFLDWAARESGRSWRFADPAASRDAGAAIVHGSIQGLTVEEALETVLPSCGLRHRVDGGLLVIESDGT